jgi:hypothetical protein
LIKRGYDVLLQAAREGEISPARIKASLKNIADFKELVQPPLPFDKERFRSLSNEVDVLNNKLNYTYGGAI